jgi:signal transduction histidine kinase
MADLVESFLEQTPACLWLVAEVPEEGRASRPESLVFERVWGRATGLFGKGADQLARARCSDLAGVLWCERFARALEGETLLLRERRGDTIWFVSLFPVRLDHDQVFAGGIGREITQWNLAEQELRRTVLGALKAQEFERNMMSRFLHDSVGQNLTALGLQMDLIRMDITAGVPDASERITEVQKALGEMMEAVREYSYELNPGTVERAGLRTALDRMATRLRERYSGTIRVNVDPSSKIAPGLAIAIYQIAQEAVGNAVQHSGCTSIDISMKTARGCIVLEVRDNGRGFDPDNIEGGQRGLGLLSMEHYAAQAGMELSVVSRRGIGTTVRATRD